MTIQETRGIGTAEEAGHSRHGDAGLSRPDGPTPPEYDRAAIDYLLRGKRKLEEEFRAAPMRFVGRGAMIIKAGEPNPPVILLRSGFAFRACALPDGRSAVLDVLIPGDITGIDNIVLARPTELLIAANRIGYQVLAAARARELLADLPVAVSMLTVLAEARWRSDRLAASVGRLDAQARICVMLLDIHDRLRRRGLIEQPRFNLPLTQEKIADHLGLTLVHVNRVLRRLREARIARVERQVVILDQLDVMRELARGLPQQAILGEPLAADALVQG